jgi:hypothetical protein
VSRQKYIAIHYVPGESAAINIAPLHVAGRRTNAFGAIDRDEFTHAHTAPPTPGLRRVVLLCHMCARARLLRYALLCGNFFFFFFLYDPGIASWSKRHRSLCYYAFSVDFYYYFFFHLFPVPSIGIFRLVTTCPPPRGAGA